MKKDYIKLINRIQCDYPTVQLATIERKINQYFSLIVESYVSDIVSSTGEGYLSLTHITNKLGTTWRDNKQDQWANIINDRYPIYTVVSNARAGVSNTKIKFNQRGIHIVLDEDVILDYTEKAKEYIELAKQSDPEGNQPWLTTKIDIKSLKGRMAADVKLYNARSESHYKDKIMNQILAADTIIGIAELHNGYLPQYIERSLAGRYYYKGVNLQNCPKYVRYAALGRGYQHDISAASYTLMFELYIAVLKGDLCRSEIERQYAHIHRYVKKGGKKNVRSVVATDLCETEAEYEGMLVQVKTALAAIGFGAKASSNFWLANGKLKSGALSGIFGTNDLTNKFLKHRYIKGLLEDLKWMNKGLYEYYQDVNFDRFEGERPLHAAKGKTKVPMGKAMAHLYQGLESEVLDSAREIMGHSNVLLLVHDALITTNQMTPEHGRKLKDLYGPNLYFDMNEVIFSVEDKSEANDEIATRRKAHIARIATEEAAAVEVVEAAAAAAVVVNKPHKIDNLITNLEEERKKKADYMQFFLNKQRRK